MKQRERGSRIRTNEESVSVCEGEGGREWVGG